MLKSNNLIIAVLFALGLFSVVHTVNNYLDTPVVEFDIKTHKPVYVVDPTTGDKTKIVSSHQLPERYQRAWASSAF